MRPLHLLRSHQHEVIGAFNWLAMPQIEQIPEQILWTPPDPHFSRSYLIPRSARSNKDTLELAQFKWSLMLHMRIYQSLEMMEITT